MDYPPYVSFEELRDSAYGITIPDAAQDSVERLIAKAQTRLLRRVPSIPARIANGTLDAELVRGALEDIVLRVVRNPNGYSAEQAGEFSYRIDRAVASGKIEILPDDVADLLPPKRTRAVRSMRLNVPSWRLP